uniref:Alternative protein MKL1 n=1 Tax=Homo sapiens TaxID=9606 RepID=L8E8L9_HUMAN|nr:alternative protein MKL1 [Homo sapiens]
MGWTEEGPAKMMMNQCSCPYLRHPVPRVKLLPMNCRSSPCSPS